MGLEKYNIAPDDNGGRPEKEEEEGEMAREPVGDNPLTLDNDNKDYWQKMYDEYEDIELISHHASVRSDTAKQKMAEHDVGYYDVEVEEPPQKSPEPRNTSEEKNPNSGFAAIINNAK